jgi:putative copper export protein
MTARPPDPEPRRPPTDEDIAWVASHLPEMRRRVAGNEILFWWIGITVVLGLIANIAGFLWASTATGTADQLTADLLRSLGTALWTGAVLVLLIQVVPNLQRRAAIRELRKYEDKIETSRGIDPDAER